MKRLDAIRERVEKATPGPWRVGGPWPATTVCWQTDPGVANVEPPSWAPVCRVESIRSERSYQAAEDAAFIAAARTDVPYLLGLLDQAREALSPFRDAGIDFNRGRPDNEVIARICRGGGDVIYTITLGHIRAAANASAAIDAEDSATTTG